MSPAGSLTGARAIALALTKPRQTSPDYLDIVNRGAFASAAVSGTK